MRWFVRRKEYEAIQHKLKEVIREQENQIAALQTERSHLLHEIKLLRDRLASKDDPIDNTSWYKKELCYA